MQICPNCGEENPDRFRLCGICGVQLTQAARAEEVRKTVSIVFSDLVGSTNLAEQLDTESLREILNAYFTEMKAVLERHGGTVEKFIGDAIMAVFGLPKLHEDDALRAVRAAFEMKRSLEQVNARLEASWGVRLQNRTGVNTGVVIAGDVTAGQWLVTGDAVNTVARLEQNAPTGEILIGDSTYRLVKDAVNIERVRPLELKGKAERVVAYLLRGVTAADEGISRRLDVSMVGRQRELKALMDVLGRATEDRKGQLVTVFGSAGVGKTRLLREFVTVAGAQPTTLRGHCLSYGDGITFWPLAEVIRQAAAIAEDDPLELARSKLFGLAGHEVRDAMERVAAVIGLSSENYPLQETFWAVRRLLESLAGERPLVVVVEDIHWAEQTLMDLLAYVAAEATAPIVLVCSARPELLEAHDDWAQEGARVQRLALTPLSEDESRRVIENLLGTTAFDGRIGARVIEAAEGNPLFVEQMLSMLIHDGILSRDDAGGWTLTSNIGAVTAPPSISALLSARLDRLSSSERAVMERGAVIGQSFFRSAVEALASTDVRERLNETLASLVRKELIHDDRSQFAGQKTYRFVHALIRDAAYHGLRKRTRAELHAGFVDWIERTLPDRMMELEEIRGYHLEQAYLILVQLARADEHVVGLGARGAACLSSAGRRALVRGDLPAASDLLQRAAALLPSTDRQHPRFLLEAGEALMETGEFPLAETVLNAGIEGAATLEDQALELTGRMILADLRHTTSLESTGEQVMAEAQHALPILAELGDHEGQARAWRLITQVNWEACRWGASESAAEKVIEHARLAGDTVLEARALPALATCALYGPRPVPEAIELCRGLLERTGSDCKAAAVTTRALAHLEAMRGNFDRARHLYRTSRASLLEFGWKLHAAVTSQSSGPIEMLAGDPAAAEAELRHDYRALQEMGENYHLSTTAAFLAEALFEQGQLEKAERFTRASEELATEGDITSQFLWRTVRGKILAHQGYAAAGVILVRQALDLMATAEEPDSEASGLLDLAEVLALEHKLEQARQALEHAIALFEAKGNIVASQRARERLAVLAPAAQRLRRSHEN